MGVILPSCLAEAEKEQQCFASLDIHQNIHRLIDTPNIQLILHQDILLLPQHDLRILTEIMMEATRTTPLAADRRCFRCPSASPPCPPYPRTRPTSGVRRKRKCLILSNVFLLY